MKATIAILAAIVTAASAAVPTGEGWYMRRADEIDFSQVEIVDLVVTDFDGKKYSGTAKSVYDEIEKLHGPAAVNTTSAAIGKRDLAKRSINCTWGNKAIFRANCDEGTSYLFGLGNRRCAVAGTPSGKKPVCARVSCSDSCGIFYCNKTNKAQTCRCGDIPGDVTDIANRCEDGLTFFHGAKDFKDHYIGVNANNC